MNTLPTPNLSSSLPADALSSYRQEGYFHARQVLPDDLLDCCQQVLEQWVESMARTWQEKGLLQDTRPDLGFRDRFNTIWEAAGRPTHNRSPRRDLVQVDSRGMFDIVRHPALLDLAEYFIGSREIISHGVWNSRPKSPDAAFTDTPWHQDGQYFREQAHIHIMTLWFPLHDVGEDESCLAVSPDVSKTNLYENFEYENGFVGIRRDQTRELTTVVVPMQRGDALCFPQLTPHRAMPNQSGRMRWSMDMRFVQTDKAMPPALDVGLVARSADHSQLTSYEEWLAKWTSAQY